MTEDIKIKDAKDALWTLQQEVNYLQKINDVHADRIKELLVTNGLLRLTLANANIENEE